MTATEPVERLKAGATEIQLYTGFVYEGPFLIWRILKALRNQA
jgi:dihydroorotate dehydrogenase